MIDINTADIGQCQVTTKKTSFVVVVHKSISPFPFNFIVSA